MVLVLYAAIQGVVLGLLSILISLYIFQLYLHRGSFFTKATHVHDLLRISGLLGSISNLLWNIDPFGIYGIWNPELILAWRASLSIIVVLALTFVWYRTMVAAFPFLFEESECLKKLTAWGVSIMVTFGLALYVLAFIVTNRVFTVFSTIGESVIIGISALLILVTYFGLRRQLKTLTANADAVSRPEKLAGLVTMVTKWRRYALGCVIFLAALTASTAITASRAVNNLGLPPPDSNLPAILDGTEPPEIETVVDNFIFTVVLTIFLYSSWKTQEEAASRRSKATGSSSGYSGIRRSNTKNSTLEDGGSPEDADADSKTDDEFSLNKEHRLSTVSIATTKRFSTTKRLSEVLLNKSLRAKLTSVGTTTPASLKSVGVATPASSRATLTSVGTATPASSQPTSTSTSKSTARGAETAERRLSVVARTNGGFIWNSTSSIKQDVNVELEPTSARAAQEEEGQPAIDRTQQSFVGHGFSESISSSMMDVAELYHEHLNEEPGQQRRHHSVALCPSDYIGLKFPTGTSRKRRVPSLPVSLGTSIGYSQPVPVSSKTSTGVLTSTQSERTLTSMAAKTAVRSSSSAEEEETNVGKSPQSFVGHGFSESISSTIFDVTELDDEHVKEEPEHQRCRSDDAVSDLPVSSTTSRPRRAPSMPVVLNTSFQSPHPAAVSLKTSTGYSRPVPVSLKTPTGVFSSTRAEAATTSASAAKIATPLPPSVEDEEEVFISRSPQSFVGHGFSESISSVTFDASELYEDEEPDHERRRHHSADIRHSDDVLFKARYANYKKRHAPSMPAFLHSFVGSSSAAKTTKVCSPSKQEEESIAGHTPKNITGHEYLDRHPEQQRRQADDVANSSNIARSDNADDVVVDIPHAPTPPMALAEQNRVSPDITRESSELCLLNNGSSYGGGNNGFSYGGGNNGFSYGGGNNGSSYGGGKSAQENPSNNTNTAGGAGSGETPQRKKQVSTRRISHTRNETFVSIPLGRVLSEFIRPSPRSLRKKAAQASGNNGFFGGRSRQEKHGNINGTAHAHAHAKEGTRATLEPQEQGEHRSRRISHSRRPAETSLPLISLEELK